MKTSEFKDYCFHQHDVECNQKYNKTLPYSYHLDMVSLQCENFIHLVIPFSEARGFVRKGCYGHDLIEDARISYNDIKDLVGIEVAEIIYLCTENKGRNRLARKSVEFYKELATNELAVFVKLCDILANSTFSYENKSSMFDKYKAEWPKVREILYIEKYDELFKTLDNLYSK